MSWDEGPLPDHKDPRVFRHAKLGPEEAKHKRRWDKKKCKRNKGGNHEMELVKDERHNTYVYRRREEDGQTLFERRRSFYQERQWTCKHCGKHGDWNMWGRRGEIEKNAHGEWEVYLKRPVLTDNGLRHVFGGYAPKAPYRKSHGYRKPKESK